MFYAQFVLSKKGPLAKIWLAAHWEKKLSKAQIYETNVADAVEEVMRPKVKIALRTTGHLLLGIVRIYSKRVEYLLDDCNSAFLKVNRSMRTSLRSTGNASELVISNFDDADLIDDLDLELPAAPVRVLQSRPDDITLREDNVGITEPACGSFADCNGGLDDFGEGGAPIDLMTDDYYTNKGKEIGAGRFTPIDNNLSAEAARHAPGAPDSFMNSVGHIDPSMASVGNMDDIDNFLGMQPEVIDPSQRTNDGSSLSLAPLEPDLALASPRRIPKRRRKRLIVDEEKDISSDFMKDSMADYLDIMKPCEVAPPTKKLMQLRENGGTDRLFSAPGCPALCDSTFLRLYQSHLVLHSKLPEATEDSESVASVRNELEMADVVTEEPDYYPEMSFGDLGTVDLAPPEPVAPDSFHLDPISFDPDPIDLQLDPIVEEREVDENAQPGLQVSPVREGEKQQHPRRRQRHDVYDESSSDEDDVDQRCSRRTHAVANAISNRLKSSDTVTLNDLLTRGSTQRTAAQKFYALLELAKKHAIKVRQDEPFGEISISAGPQMAVVLAD